MKNLNPSVRGCSLQQIRYQLGPHRLRGLPHVIFLAVLLNSRFFFAYQNDRSDKLVVTATGTGGLAELQEKLDPAKGSFAYARVTYCNDKESQREKFILVTWIGAGCKIMRKAKVTIRLTT